MPKVTFTYFNMKGLGEGPRLLLAYGGQEFEDRRLELQQWPEWKSKSPLGQVPFIEIDGKTYAQSFAIARYLGHKYGVAGTTLEEDLEIDQIADFINDIRVKAVTAQFELNPEVKKKKQEENLPHLLGMLDTLHDIVVKNDGHIALGKLTWADFVFAGVYNALKWLMGYPEADTKYPAFKKLQEKVLSLPKVKEFVAKAPKTDIQDFMKGFSVKK